LGNNQNRNLSSSNALSSVDLYHFVLSTAGNADVLVPVDAEDLDSLTTDRFLLPLVRLAFYDVHSFSHGS